VCKTKAFERLEGEVVNTIFEEANVIKESPPKLEESLSLGGYTHLQITAHATPNRPNTSICFDTSARRNLINAEYLKQFTHKVKEVLNGKTIYGFNRGPTALNKYAYWHFYVLGIKEDGLIGLVKIYAGA